MGWIVLGVFAAVLLLAWAQSAGTPTQGGSVLSALGAAIAKAEGSFLPGSVPQRANNPGDLKLGDQGLGTIGGKTIFSTLAAGEAALEHQLSLILSGTSRVYNEYAQSLGLQDSSQLTIAQLADKYTGGDNPQSWAATVAGELGVTPDTSLAEVGG